MTVVANALTAVGPYTGLPGFVHNELWSVYPPEAGCVSSVPEFVIEPSVAVLTNTALAYIARAAAEGLAFRVSMFRVGSSGYNTPQFYQALPLAGDSDVMAPRYEGPITNREEASDDGTVWAYTCAVPSNLTAVVGEVSLVAEILHSPEDVGEVGTTFTYAVGHSPAVTKHQRSASTFRFLVRGG